MPLNKIKYVLIDEIDSTNNYLKENYYNMLDFTVVRTNYQNSGRGQFERTWESNKGENLLFSLLLKNHSLDSINIIKKIVIESLLLLLETYNIKGKFKEPNDIYVNDKKILGILIETKVNINNFFDYIIIGIGLNVNQTKFVNANATSIKLETNYNYKIDETLYDFIKIFHKNYNDKMNILK